MSLTIRALEQSKPQSEGIDSWIGNQEFPLVEDRYVTFVYRGEADQVLLQHFIYGLPTSQDFKRIEGTDLWYLTIEVPPHSRFEYKFDVVKNDQHSWIRDPLNPRMARDPFGSNSVCHTAGYEPPFWVQSDENAREGSIHKLYIDHPNGSRNHKVLIYIPARYRKSRRYPLLVVHDGQDYLKYASLKTVLDNLIHRLEIPPMIAALTQSEDRIHEYAANETHAQFVVESLLPLLESRLPLQRGPETRCLMGASFGAVASLHTAWKYPGIFGKLLLQSGSFAFTDIGWHQRSPAFDPVVHFVNEFRKHPGRPSEKIFVSCGTYESLIYENRSMVPLLQETGINVKYREFRDGHNWENWRDRLREGLSWLFPGPLWMVYE
ncbi:MAG: enterochelin esterase [Acidobacteria bacterium]|nr:enterochelin esterase [Acidobacteriota bacterium]